MNLRLPRLNLPFYQFKYGEEKGQPTIFDPNRKKYLLLTPEEWVRQNFIQFLVNEKNYPASRIQLETKLQLKSVWKRTDAVVYGKRMQPQAIIECKAPDVKISQAAFDQIGVYNSALKVEYLFVTNGKEHYCCRMNYGDKSYEFLDGIPDYSLLEK